MGFHYFLDGAGDVGDAGVGAGFLLPIMLVRWRRAVGEYEYGRVGGLKYIL